MAAEERVDERGDRVKILFELAVDGRGWPLAALTIPPDADAAAVVGQLRAGVADGRWEYEEGCVNKRWLSL